MATIGLIRVEDPLEFGIVITRDDGSIERFLEAGPRDSLSRLLDTFEVDAMVSRARAVLDEGRFPEDDTGGQRYPWPLV